MKNTKTRIFATVLLVFWLIAAVVACTSCGPRKTLTDATVVEHRELGTGGTGIYFYAVDKNNNAVEFLLHTDKTTLGAALTEFHIVSGENGLYDTVNGVTADYAKDGAWWALYDGATMASCGADDLVIREGGSYSFIYTVG